MSRIGVDEAGKGDYFGYLVVAAVFLEDSKEEKLKAMGVKDSKMLSDSAVKSLAQKIKKACPYDIVKISPERYNDIYKKFSSLNKLLAWGHARAIENLLGKTRPDLVITDKFADESFLKSVLFEKGKNIKIVQMVRAETDMAVAAASILAREEFLATLRQLGRDVGYVLPKGSTHVEEAAKAIKDKYGSETLYKVAKMHFKITKRLEKK